MTDQQIPAQAAPTEDTPLFAFEYPAEVGEANIFTLPASRVAVFDVTVINVSGFPLKARIGTEILDEAAVPWITTEENAEQDFEIGAEQVYSFRLNVPSSAREGDYRLQLSVLDLAFPDETLTLSDVITIRVPPLPPTRIPAAVIVIALLLLVAVVIGVVLFIVSNRPERLPNGVAFVSGDVNSPQRQIYVVDLDDIEQVSLLIPGNRTLDTSYRTVITQVGDQFIEQTQPFTVVALQEYDPAWSPDGCQIVYGARLGVGRYLLQPGETLYDLQLRLGLSDSDFTPIVTAVRASRAFDAQVFTPAQALTAVENGYLRLTTNPDLAAINYFLKEGSPAVQSALYRAVSRLVYNTIVNRGTIAGLYLMDRRFPASSPRQLLPQIVYQGVIYEPGDPAWSPDGAWIAFSYVGRLNESVAEAPSFLALLNTQTGEVSAIQPIETRAANGLHYDSDPQWWQGENDTQGLVFVSRRHINEFGVPISQIYGLSLSVSGANGAPISTPTVQVLPLFTPTGTIIAATATPVFQTPTAIPPAASPTGIGGLNAATPLPLGQLEGRLFPTTRPPTRVFAPLPPPIFASGIVNLSGNMVNDYAPVMLDEGRMVFVSDRAASAAGTGAHLYVMDRAVEYLTGRLNSASAQFDHVRRLSESSLDPGTSDNSPAASPNGESVVFSSQRLQIPQLYTLSVGGGTRVRLLRDNTRPESDPTWQPVECAAEGRAAAQ